MIAPYEFEEDEIKDLHKKIGQNIKHYREERKMSQLELSLALGYKSLSVVSKGEIGLENRRFNVEHLYKIATILDVDIRDLFEGVETKQ